MSLFGDWSRITALLSSLPYTTHTPMHTHSHTHTVHIFIDTQEALLGEEDWIKNHTLQVLVLALALSLTK
jgi:hypothetical protein